MDKVRTAKGLREWVARVRRLSAGMGEPLFALEYKFDGLTVTSPMRAGGS